MRRYLCVATIVICVVACFINPLLAIWLGIGVALGATVAVVPRIRDWGSGRVARLRVKHESSRPTASRAGWTRTAAVAAVAVAMVLALTFGLYATTERYGFLSVPGKRLVTEVELTAVVKIAAQFMPRRQAFQVHERLMIPATTLREQSTSSLASFARPRTTERALTRTILHGLRRAGWQAEASTDALNATRNVVDPVHQPELLPARTSNTLPLALPMQVGEFEGVPIHIATSENSRLSILAPTRMIASTAPTSTPAATVQEQEERVIDVEGQLKVVDYEVRSAILRSELLAPLADATFWTPVKWLVLLFIAVATGALSSVAGERLGWRTPRSRSEPAGGPRRQEKKRITPPTKSG
jgi:hypothetical protein